MGPSNRPHDIHYKSIRHFKIGDLIYFIDFTYADFTPFKKYKIEKWEPSTISMGAFLEECGCCYIKNDDNYYKRFPDLPYHHIQEHLNGKMKCVRFERKLKLKKLNGT